jgi:hypothetical protein
VGLNESLPVTDFLAKTYGSVTGKFDLLQSTVAKAHVLTEYGLIDLKERYLPDSEAGNIVLRVYFCVPPFRFRKPASKTKSSLHIEKQPIQKSQRDTTKVKCAQGLVIHQFALEVNPGLLARKHK